MGGLYLILKSYPHVKAALFSKSEEPEADDSTLVELNKEEVDSEAVTLLNLDESLVNIDLWSEEDLKKWLSEVCILMRR